VKSLEQCRLIGVCKSTDPFLFLTKSVDPPIFFSNPTPQPHPETEVLNVKGKPVNMNAIIWIWINSLTITTKEAEERSMIQIWFRTQDPNVEKGTIWNPRQNSQLIHDPQISKSTNIIDFPQKSTILALFIKAKSVAYPPSNNVHGVFYDIKVRKEDLKLPVGNWQWKQNLFQFYYVRLLTVNTGS